MKKMLFLTFVVISLCCDAKDSTVLSVTYKAVGKNFIGLATVVKTNDTFFIASRQIKGLPFRILATDLSFTQGDSVSGKLHIATFYVLFSGSAAGGSVSLRLFDPQTKQLVGSIETIDSVPAKRDYPLLCRQIIDSTEKLIFNKSFVESPAWEKYKTNMLQKSARMQDDLEMMILFFSESQQLPFSHYTLTRFSTDDFISMTRLPKDNAATGELFMNGNATAVLKVNSFDGDGSRLDSMMKIVLAAKYKHLVIDLRGNGGGNASSAMMLAQYLLPERKEMGALVTRQWFDSHSLPPVVSDYPLLQKLPRSNPMYLKNLFSIYPGFVLVVEPSKKQFTGDIYILTDGGTASTCEPFVYGLQQLKRATIVGEKTSGAMLARVPVRMINDFVLFIPMADYFASDGKRLDQVGVVPDIVISGSKALDKALALIGN